VCLRGVSLLQREWLERSDDEGIAVYVVWVPQLGARPGHVPGAAELMPDPRATHFWDGEETLGRAYARDLADRPIGPLWDVYFLYGPDAEWTDDLPRPLELWMQQLPAVGDLAPRLDAGAFAAAAGTLSQERDP